MRSKTITPTEEEDALVSQILELSKCRDGQLTPDAAVDIFSRSGLSHAVLGEIWTIADEDNNGRLSENEIVVAIRLMGWLQTDKQLSESLLEKPGPLPFLEGITSHKRGESSSSSSQLPPILPSDIRTFHSTFIGEGPVHGYLEGEKVRDIFMRSNLAYSDLSLIWNLVDTKERGSLNFREFAMGMYLIESLKACQLSSVPSSIPLKSYEQIDCVDLTNTEPPSTPLSNNSPRSSLPPPPPPPANRSSSSLRLRHPLPPNVPPKFPPKPTLVKVNRLNYSWDISQAEKVDYDNHFNVLDREGTGFIKDHDADRFFIKYKLPADELAHIWELASIKKENKLSQDEFAVAMHLIQDRLAGRELPWELPASLVPPSLRTPNSPLPAYQHPTRSDTPKEKENPPQSPVVPGYPDGSKRRMSRSVTSASSLRSPVPDSPGPPQSPLSQSSPSTSLPLTFLADAPGKLPNTPQLTRRRTSAATSLSPTTDEDPLEELKIETKGLRLQIKDLLQQLASQNELRDTNKILRQENDQFQAKIVDLESSMSQVLNQMQNHSNILSDEVTQEISRLSRRVAELEQTESQLQQTSSNLEMIKRDNVTLTTQIRDLRAAEVTHKSDLQDAQHAMEDLEKENIDLKTRLADMGKALSQPDTANSSRELRVFLSDVTQENQRLKEQVRETELSMEQMLLSGRNHTQHDELMRENRELKLQIQELELLAAELQSSNDDNNLQRVLVAVTRENEGMKARIREMQSSSAQQRTAHDAQTTELQRRLNQLIEENNRLKTELQSAAVSSHSVDDTHMPPPAYDDTFIEV